jgi:hypothetical protein
MDKTTLFLKKLTHFINKDIHRLQMKGWKMIFQATGNLKQAEVTILISDKIDFKTKTVRRDKESHCIMIKESIQQEDMIINLYSYNVRTPTFLLYKIMGSIKTFPQTYTMYFDPLHLPITFPFPLPFFLYSLPPQ